MPDSKKPADLSRRRFLGQTGSAALASLLAGPYEALRAATRDTRIVRAAIYPAIGIARIGNSVDHGGYLIGPEVTEPHPTWAGRMRDDRGAIKRQAARFRIYGFNEAGEVVRELTEDASTDIEWTAHLANKKAAWYRFVVAMDIPEAAKLSVPLRNASVEGADRASLVIDPGPRSIRGRSRSGRPYRFDGGKFMGVPVSLGELRTDSQGRLLVLSGLGKSGSPQRTPPFVPEDADTFNNADGWYDDIADGPVSATVRIGGREIEVESAWVAVAPPNYAPDVIGWRTMHDLLVETYVDAGWLEAPARTSFTRDVLPLFRRLSGLQWVNKGFADRHGRKTDSDFGDVQNLHTLLDRGRLDEHAEMLKMFRTSEAGSSDEKLWPMLYGDAYGTYEKTPREHFIVSKHNLLHLQRWASGDYIDDYDPAHPPRVPRKLSEVPLQEQPEMLTRAALHFCLADAFHPGCELTWPMRHITMYRAPFRIKTRGSESLDPGYGKELNYRIARAKDGPLHEQGPGDLTRWMAVPWQGDTVFCRSGYEPEYDPYLSTFWPARVPNQVLSEESYRRVIDTRLPRQERLAAFEGREHWVRHMKGEAPDQILQMVEQFGEIGIVEARPGVPNDPDFPEVMLVENLGPAFRRAEAGSKQRSVPQGQVPSSGTPRGGELPVDHGGHAQTPAQQAGWESEAQLRAFRAIRMPRRPVPR